MTFQHYLLIIKALEKSLKCDQFRFFCLPGRYFIHREPKIGGVSVNLEAGNPVPASFNRNFGAEIDEDLRFTLMLGPSLIRKPNKLKKIILEKEDTGYQNSRNVG